jgi:hypothetical protein
VITARTGELLSVSERGCLDATARTLSATIVGTLAGDEVSVGVGARQLTRVATSASTTLTFTELASGALDVAAARLRAVGAPSAMLADRIFVQRGANPVGTSLGTIALDAALVPDPFTVAVGGVGSGETVTVSSTLRTAGGTSVSLGTSTGSGVSHDARALPATARIAGDLHLVTATSVGTDNGHPITRTITRMTATPTAESLTLGAIAPIATFNVTETQAGNALVSSVTRTQTDYLRLYTLYYEQDAPGFRRRVTHLHTMRASVPRDTPDRNFAISPLAMAGASGWNVAWEASQTRPMAWTTGSFGWEATDGLRAPIADGVVVRSATRSGTWTPTASAAAIRRRRN